MIIGVQFYDMHLHEYQGKSYSYLCNENISVGSNVRVPNGRGGTSVGRVTRVGITEAELEIPARALKEVISIEPNPAPEADYHESVIPEKQLSLMDIPDEEEPKEETLSMVIVKQLPIIEENLHLFRDTAIKNVENAMALACTEDTVKDVKKIRAELNANFKEIETLRKEVKAKILAPYEEFEKVYKDCVTNIFVPADKQLKEKIDEVENGLKDVKREKVRIFFEEYRDSLLLNPEFVKFEECGIKITLSDSERALKAWVKNYIDTVAGDINAIRSMEFSDEIYAEYRVTRQLNTAVAAVNERHARIERERIAREEAEKAAQEKQERLEQAAQKVDSVITPPEAEMPPVAVSEPQNEDEETYEVAFKVTGTIEQLKELKRFMKERGMNYVSI